MRLTAEVLRLRLMQANLVATGSKQAMVQRLLDHAEDNITLDQEDQSDPATPVGQSDSEQDHERRVPARRSSLSSQSSSSTPQRGGSRSLHRPRVIAASTSPSGSVASRSPVPDTGRTQVAARLSLQLHLFSVLIGYRGITDAGHGQGQLEQTLRALHPAAQGLLQSVDPAIPALRRAIDRGRAAKKGPNWTAQPAPPLRCHDQEAVVTGGTTATAAVLAAVARDKARSIQWDHLKEDLLVWCATRQPFRAFKPSDQGLNTARQTPTAPGATQFGARTLHVASGQEICRRYNFGNCARADCKFAHRFKGSRDNKTIIERRNGSFKAGNTKRYVLTGSIGRKEEGLQSPVRGNQILRLLLRGIQRSNLASSPKSCCRHPITPGILAKLLSSSHASRSPRSQDKRMFQAAATLAFFGFLRIGEFTATPHRPVSLSKGDIQLGKHELQIRLGRSKTDQWGKGALVKIGCSRDSCCPVRAMERYLERDRRPITAPLFQYSNGSVLSAKAFRRGFTAT
eukprot:Em0010g395a